jgi:hypothetical protein
MHAGRADFGLGARQARRVLERLFRQKGMEYRVGARMINGSAAGHTFVSGICACGRRFVDIQYYGEAQVNQPNIAHSGSLTVSEAQSIVTLKVALDKVYGLVLA